MGVQNVKKRVLAGMRPTGRLHLGNYLGSANGMVALQNDSSCETFYMVVDLHGLTTPYDRTKFADTVKSVVLDYLSIGLDPEKSAVFIQSQVPEHVELAYYLSTIVNVAEMSHLPTYKEKVKQHPKHVTMALLNYPVLMAADILAYKANLVPVGLDQEPHIEVARKIAKKMNGLYGTAFPEPKRFTLPGGEYIPSLKGIGKMSKSVEGSYINLTDDLETIKKRLAGVPTDIGKGESVPTEGGIPVLLKLVELFDGKEKRHEYETQYTHKGILYSDMKAELAGSIYRELKPIQARRAELEKDSDAVKKTLAQGAEKARTVVSRTLKEVREKIGIISL